MDNEIKCDPFDLETNPKIGVIAKVNPENQYLYTRLIVTRPTRKYGNTKPTQKSPIFSPDCQSTVYNKATTSEFDTLRKTQ